MESNYCAMARAGLLISLPAEPGKVRVANCCLRSKSDKIDSEQPIWQLPELQLLRNLNKKNQLDSQCQRLCKNAEKSGQFSFRTGMNNGLKVCQDNTGPARIDLQFDISCNLACRTCGPHSSTFWQKHLKENGLSDKAISKNIQTNNVIEILSKLDLSNLQQFVFCGGETLMGKEYWKVAKWLVENVPNAKQQLTLCFQTNATQDIPVEYFETIHKCFLVKLHCSLDGVGSRFEYLRWPAQWSKTTDNLFYLRENLPSNVMFVIEETISIFNLLYLDEMTRWHRENFTTNRLGDVVNLTRHLAEGVFSLEQCTSQYIDALKNTQWQNLLPDREHESISNISKMINEIKTFDHFRNQSFEKTFPEVAEFYKNYL